MEKLTRSPQDFESECGIAANYINDNTDLPISILLSGGLDSICVCESFRQEDISFTAYTYRINDGLNDHDVKYAVEYTKKYNIPHIIIDLDVIDFWKSEGIKDYVSITKNPSPQLATHCLMIDRVSGFIIMGNGWNDLKRKDNGIVHVYSEVEDYDERFIEHRGISGIPKFYKTTSEMRYSQFVNDAIFDWISNDTTRWVDNHHWNDKVISKNKFYNTLFGQEIGTRPPISRKSLITGKEFWTSNYTGFEYLYDLDVETRQKMKTFLNFEYPWVEIPYLEYLEQFYNESEWCKVLRNKTIKRYEESL